MYRIVLWKAGFELAHLKRLLWPCADRKIYYFAFGANLSLDVLEQRRISVFESFDYVLQNAALRFSQPGFYRDHGYASADIDDNEAVYGKMYLILQRDAIRMDYFEGVPYLDAHEKVLHRDDNIEFYYYRTTRIFDKLKPTREYLDYLLYAYRKMPDVPRDYIDSMADTEVLEDFLLPNKTGLFIRNMNRWPAFMHSALVRYEVICLSITEALWNRSIFQWMIRK
ncbi:MAG: hypothetical protein GY806_01360 [Gammaproteobacteria bacterium]|nr:hypothetical protein [Gammaproteobacteria bacterium]